MSTACFFGTELNEDALRIIGENGIENAEVFYSSHQEIHPRFLYTLRRISRDYGIHIRSIHAFSTQFEPQLMSPHPRQFEEALDMFHEVLASAALLGADTYVFHGPVYLKTAKKLHIDWNRVGDRITEIADIAKEYGVKLCYETVHWCWFHSPSFARDLLKHTSSDNLYFTLDLKQAAQSGYSPEEYIDAMKGRLAHVHLCDFIRSTEDGILPVLPFEGQLSWGTLRAKLKEMHFDGYLMLEVYTGNYDGVPELMRCFRDVTEFFC